MIEKTFKSKYVLKGKNVWINNFLGFYQTPVDISFSSVLKINVKHVKLIKEKYYLYLFSQDVPHLTLGLNNKHLKEHFSTIYFLKTIDLKIYEYDAYDYEGICNICFEVDDTIVIPFIMKNTSKISELYLEKGIANGEISIKYTNKILLYDEMIYDINEFGDFKKYQRLEILKHL